MNRNAKKIKQMRQYIVEMTGCYKGYPAPTAYQFFVLKTEEKKQRFSNLLRTYRVSDLQDSV